MIAFRTANSVLSGADRSGEGSLAFRTVLRICFAQKRAGEASIERDVDVRESSIESGFGIRSLC